MAKLYTLKNYASVVTHYTMAGGIAACAYALGQPWAVVAGAAVAVGMTALQMKIGLSIFDDGTLARHPKNHKFSPELGNMVEDLYKASGLSADEFPVYDFKMNEKTAREKSSKAKLAREVFDKLGKISNAAASHWDKPIIMISEPLLKLLDDDEEKAVLAHEFAHAAAQHMKMTLPHNILSRAARATAGFATIAASFSSGLANFSMAIGTAIGVNLGFRYLHPKKELLGSNNDDLTLKEIFEKKKIERVSKAFSLASGLTAFGYFVPAYLPVWAAATGINIVGNLVEKSLSRSDEYQADRGAVVLGGDPLALITSLRKLTELSNRSFQKAWGDGAKPEVGSLSKWWKQANSTHPTLERRIERLADMARAAGRDEQAIQHALTAKLDISRGEDIPYDVLKVMASRFV